MHYYEDNDNKAYICKAANRELKDLMFYLKCVYVNGCYQPREYYGSMRIPIFDQNHTLKPSWRRSGAEKWFCHAISPLSPCTAALLHSIIKNRSIISLVLQPKYFPNQAGILQNNMVQVGNDVNNTVYKKNTFFFVDLLFFRDKKKLVYPWVWWYVVAFSAGLTIPHISWSTKHTSGVSTDNRRARIFCSVWGTMAFLTGSRHISQSIYIFSNIELFHPRKQNCLITITYIFF